MGPRRLPFIPEMALTKFDFTTVPPNKKMLMWSGTRNQMRANTMSESLSFDGDVMQAALHSPPRG
jgi:hypothetical protein